MKDKKIKVSDDILVDIKKEISEIISMNLDNISYEINDYEPKYDMSYNGEIFIKDINLNDESTNKTIMDSFEDLLSKHFEKINK